MLSLRAFRRGRTVLRLVTQGLPVWVNKSCTVGRVMTAVTKIVTHQQAGSDASLGFVEVGHTRFLWAGLKRFRGLEFTLELLG